MKLVVYCFGKENESYVNEGVQLFTKRIKNYTSLEWIILPTPKNANALTEEQYKQKEAEVLLTKITKDDYLISLDESGKNITSPELGNQIEKAALHSSKRLVFIIGGAYGIHLSVLDKANFIWSLSKLVFPHQLVRLLLAEQIYRAYSINNNEKYHH